MFFIAKIVIEVSLIFESCWSINYISAFCPCLFRPLIFYYWFIYFLPLFITSTINYLQISVKLLTYTYRMWLTLFSRVAWSSFCAHLLMLHFMHVSSNTAFHASKAIFPTIRCVSLHAHFNKKGQFQQNCSPAIILSLIKLDTSILPCSTWGFFFKIKVDYNNHYDFSML